MMTIILDVQLTRRKRAHLVVEPDGETRFASSQFSEVIEWLAEREVSALNIETVGGESYVMSLRSTKSVLTDFAKAPAMAGV